MGLLPGDIVDWLETFGQSFTNTVPEDERETLLGQVREALLPTHCDADGNWMVDYVRLRFAATRL